MPVSFWSPTTSNLNGSIDPTINWAPSQAPSSVSPSARATLMAVAQYRNDVAGSTVTTGTSTAYSLSTFSNFNQAPGGSTALQTLASQQISFTPNTTNTAGSPSVTLTVDALGPFPIRTSPNQDLTAGTLVQGTPYVVLFNPTDSAFYLQGFYGTSPAIVPLGGIIDYIGSTAPNSAYAFPFGQAISRTTFATLFALIGTTYGPGDGVTTFNLPDVRGRVLACLDNAGGTAAGRMTAANGFDGTILGNGGGSQTETITLAQLPTGITSSNTAAIAGTITGTATSIEDGQINNAAGADTAYPTNQTGTNPSPVTMSVSGTASIPIGGANVTSNNTGGQALPIIQPTLVVNKLLRII
jgi:microcystin-dependent protein